MLCELDEVKNTSNLHTCEPSLTQRFKPDFEGNMATMAVRHLIKLASQYCAQTVGRF